MEKSKIIIYESDEYSMDPFEKEDIIKTIKKHELLKNTILDWKISTGIFVIIFLTLLFFLPVKEFTLSSQQYLLSSIFQGLSAIFALGITGLLVGLQILNNRYSYRIVKYLPKNAWNLLFYIMWYALALISILILLNALNEEIIHLPWYGIIVSLLIALTGALIVYTGSKIWNIVALLDPEIFFDAIYLEIMRRNGIENRLYIYQHQDDIFEMFSEIILKSLNMRQENTAQEGIKKLTNIFLNDITSVPDKESEKLKKFKNIR